MRRVTSMALVGCLGICAAVACSRKPKDAPAPAASVEQVAPPAASGGVATAGSAAAPTRTPEQVKAHTATPLPTRAPAPAGSLCKFERAVTGNLGKATL